MAGVEIPLPDIIHYKTTILTRFSDSRSAKVASGVVVSHVTYENIVIIVNEVFDQFLEAYNYSKANIAGSNITVPSLEITYHDELQANESVNAEVSVAEIGNKSIKVIFILKKGNGNIAVKARLSLIFFNYKEKKPEAVPEEFRNQFKSNG
jgi:acyl-CoA thioesterase FadM